MCINVPCSRRDNIERYGTTHEQQKGVNQKMAGKSDVIFVGNKPPMSYVLAIITAFSGGSAKEITLKARGQAITTAVDVAEITRSRFVKDLKVNNIAIGTAEMPPREGENRSRMVSTIEITLSKE
jgi:DNA-binding protein